MTAFLKMHGLGNDFVVLDGRAKKPALSTAMAQRIADRHTGVGCDQLVIIEPPRTKGADAFMRILNSDGGEVEACGNAVRCVGAILMDERGTSRTTIETLAGPVAVSVSPRGITADMGPARLEWQDIPLARAMDTLSLPIAEGAFKDPVGVGMGNPHAVFFVSDVAQVPLADIGPKLEHHALFPKRANVEFAQVLAPGRIRMRVWERGAGITQACGTGACATLVAAARRGLAPRKSQIVLDGGTLEIEWRDHDNHVLMTGPTSLAFSGDIDLEAYADEAAARIAS
jgi:diaminopimelate epimerase